MIRYELIHDGSVLHTLTTTNPDADIIMINLMLEVSDEKPGEFSIYSVEIDAETGREKYTWVATTKSGGKENVKTE